MLVDTHLEKMPTFKLSGYNSVLYFGYHIVAHLVAMAYLPRPSFAGHAVLRRKDKNKANDEATNLEWVPGGIMVEELNALGERIGGPWDSLRAVERATENVIRISALNTAFKRNKARGSKVGKVLGRFFRKMADGDEAWEVGQLPPTGHSRSIAVEEVNALGEHKSGPYINIKAAAQATIGLDPKNAVSAPAICRAFARGKALGVKVVPCMSRYYRKVVRK